jgi:hypothetical protein
LWRTIDRSLWITPFPGCFGGRISSYFPKILHAAPARLPRKPLWHKRLEPFRLAAQGHVAYLQQERRRYAVQP